jgi:hypothetical protein
MVLARPRVRSTIKIGLKSNLYPHAFQRTVGGRVRETTVEKQFEPRILESFDLSTQELYRYLPATIHTKTEIALACFGEET